MDGGPPMAEMVGVPVLTGDPSPTEGRLGVMRITMVRPLLAACPVALAYV